MRDLDEALARLARRDQLQKRHGSGAQDPPRTAADEVAEALRPIVERHPGLTAVVRLDEGDVGTELRIASEAGSVRVMITEISEGSEPFEAAFESPSFETTAFETTAFEATAFENVPLESAPLDSAAPPAPRVLVGEFSITEDRTPTDAPVPAGPPEWPPRAQAAPGSPEARLAELIRRDPSLLETPRDR
ncbi:hypothetical protein SAMN05444365_101160 [Micromonospora pattaloongensis]|uniref:Uncharacterized protein n=1 Tax=Micromonospora pattaloongensis TaxID=405436 RepID=A0A1H3FTQ0_9ACTN|nr:hypothetical protein [Micromonospora pattaloongensis]SDX94442.1 hypothetical protein SAMN05444365_101160 [Micromonospora pattaloongensis]